MAEATKKINFLGNYVRGLKSASAQQSTVEQPVAVVVEALDEHDEKSVQELHELTGLNYLELVPAVEALGELGLADVSDDAVVLTPKGSLVKHGTV